MRVRNQRFRRLTVTRHVSRTGLLPGNETRSRCHASRPSPVISAIRHSCPTASLSSGRDASNSCRIYVSLDQAGLAMLCWLPLGSRPFMRFLLVGSRVLPPASCRVTALARYATHAADHPRGIALAFGSRFPILISRRGLAPHQLTPAPGVHNDLNPTVAPRGRGATSG